MKSSAKKVELAPYDDLFSTEESRQDAKLEKVREIPLSELHPFKNHPFKVKDDEAMMETADSVRQYGILVPAIARPDPEGGYELVAGHRRHRASELAEKETMPVIVRDLDDDAATIIMVDSNLQRESLLPSERAFAYRMKLEAMKHQGERSDLTCAQVGHKSDGKKSRDMLAHGLIGEADKAELSELLRNGKSNQEVALWLSRAYPNIVETMELETGETADYRTMPEGIELEVLDADEKRLAMLFFQWSEVAPLLRGMYARQLDGFGQERPEPAAEAPTFQSETVAVYPGDKNHLPYDVVVQTLRTNEPEPPTPVTELEKTPDEVLDEHPVSIQVNGEWQTFPNVKAAEKASYEEYKANLSRTAENFRITDDHLGEGGPKAKFQANVEAIKLLKYLEETTGQATPEQQQVLSRYVGWGGLADAFDPDKESWSKEYAQLKELLTPEEYAAARGSTLNAHYTSPTVIKAIYEAVGRMGFETGNILEPSCGVGNFFGMLPEEMRNSRLYGVELDSISGRIAQQLYPKADITVAGFETTDRRDFYDLAIGNVPFGQYQVRDKAYDKLNFSIHNYFFAKALDQVRPGGVVAFVTSRYTMDAKDSTVRRYLAQRAELLGAIRLPNNAFKANAGTEVVSDIIFLQKRDRPLDIVPEWTQTGQTEDGFSINRYFLDHPEMVLGRQEPESTAHGMDYTVNPIEGLELADQLHDAVKYIRGTYQEAELPELGEGEAIDTSIPADPNVKNYSYTVVDGDVYYRENSRMVRPDLNATAEARVKGLVGLRECVQQLIDLQMDAATPDSAIQDKQAELNRLYDSFSAKYGLINDRANRLAFADDSSYYLLCALEVIDEDGKLERKADMFTKRTIKPHKAVDTVDTASEALAVSISEKACVDMAYMSELTGKTGDELAAELQGVIFRVPGQLEKDGTPHYVTADEYLSGNVRRKLRQAQRAAQQDPSFAVNVEALTAAQPKDLDASEIEVRLGATWIDKEYIQQFMYETFDTPFYLQRNIEVNYSSFTAEWQITGKSSVSQNNVAAYTTYGTSRANAYKILEDSLNLRDVRIYDTVEDADGKERRVLNAKETTLAAQKQQAIRDAFKDWIWKDPDRRQALVRQYNEEMNSTRPREYDGGHITFGGMNPAITLREHQKNAIAHVLYGGNTLLAHEVGAGKTFEMVAAAMESKRLGLCQKSLFVVPNHLTEQWASEFLRLYPSANILVTTKKDFETHNRKKFCARIATGDYDAIIMGHSQFEKIPISRERQDIHDKKLLSIISAMLKAEVAGIGFPEKGTPQGGIISPLLSNIVLNELDWWITSQWAEMPTRHEYSGRIHTTGTKDQSKKYRELRKTKLKECYIVRYADDFKIFCRKHSDAIKLFEATKAWLKERLGLDISPEKSQIVNLKHDYSDFLGFRIKVHKGKGNKYVVISHIAPKALDRIKDSAKEKIKAIQHSSGEMEEFMVVNDYNSFVMGVHNYYRMATAASPDIQRLAFEIKIAIKNRLQERVKRRSDQPIPEYAKRYAKSKEIRFIGKNILLPIGYIQHHPPIHKKKSVNKYTAAGRAEIHKNLESVDMTILHILMRNPIMSATVEYNDNRISLYVAQKGKCAITKEQLSLEEIHCHHKTPKSLGGGDNYANLIILHERIHRLVHATQKDTISAIMQTVQLNKQQLEKLNKFRKLAGNEAITFEQQTTCC